VIFADINNPPKDGATFMLHVREGNVAMFRVGADGKCRDMVVGTVETCVVEAMKSEYPDIEVVLHDSDRAGPRTKFHFKRWSDFCTAYNSKVLTKSRVIAEFVWLCTKMADGLCELGSNGALKPTERGIAADAQEVDSESEAVCTVK